jgi:hypothetical protein
LEIFLHRAGALGGQEEQDRLRLGAQRDTAATCDAWVEDDVMQPSNVSTLLVAYGLTVAGRKARSTMSLGSVLTGASRQSQRIMSGMI